MNAIVKVAEIKGVRTFDATRNGNRVKVQSKDLVLINADGAFCATCYDDLVGVEVKVGQVINVDLTFSVGESKDHNLFQRVRVNKIFEL